MVVSVTISLDSILLVCSRSSGGAGEVSQLFSSIRMVKPEVDVGVEEGDGLVSVFVEEVLRLGWLDVLPDLKLLHLINSSVAGHLPVVLGFSTVRFSIASEFISILVSSIGVAFNIFEFRGLVGGILKEDEVGDFWLDSTFPVLAFFLFRLLFAGLVLPDYHMVSVLEIKGVNVGQVISQR